MDESDIRLAQSWVLDRITTSECPFCGRSEWRPNDELRSIMVAEIPREPGAPKQETPDGFSDVSFGDIVPLNTVAFACRHCGFVRFHVLHP